MHALVIGFGSIGKRHTRNLCASSRVEKITIFTQMPPDVTGFDNAHKINFVKSLEPLPKANFVLVANETIKHMPVLLTLAKAKIPLFIEKPVSHNLSGTEELQNIVAKNNLATLVAYNLRFLPAIQKVKQLLTDGAIGKIHFADIEVGQYLPDWQPGADYTKSFRAFKEKGGGVSIDLSHEIDYMIYLFGIPTEHKSFKRHVSDLKINSDDVYEGIFSFKSGMLCHAHMDYLERKKRRLVRISGATGEITCDFFSKKIVLESGSQNIVWDDPVLFDLNQSYVNELDHFLDVLNGKTKSLIPLAEGLSVLKFLDE